MSKPECVTFSSLFARMVLIFGVLSWTPCSGHVKVAMEATVSSSATNETMSYKVEPLPEGLVDLGEGPHWDHSTQNLYFVDLNNGVILRYSYLEDKVYRSKIEGESLASFIVPVEGANDKFAVGCGRRCVIVEWDGISETCKVERTLFTVQAKDKKYDGNRFNDAKCDPCGRLFAGTMRYVGDEWEFRYGELFKYDKGNVSLVKTDVGISNGLAWNEKTNKFYFIDTTDHDVKEYDYDFDEGTACHPKVVFDLHRPDEHLLPDGMTIDTDGNIYVATFNGHTIYKVNPTTGKVLLEIKLPVKRITSCAWGGPKLDILYVTTSNRFGETHPAGTTYKVTGLGAKGSPMTRLKL